MSTNQPLVLAPSIPCTRGEGHGTPQGQAVGPPPGPSLANGGEGVVRHRHLGDQLEAVAGEVGEGGAGGAVHRVGRGGDEAEPAGGEGLRDLAGRLRRVLPACGAAPDTLVCWNVWGRVSFNGLDIQNPIQGGKCNPLPCYIHK